MAEDERKALLRKIGCTVSAIDGLSARRESFMQESGWCRIRGVVQKKAA